MNRRWIIPLIVGLALVITGIWGIEQNRQKRAYQIYMQNQYQRMFYDLLGHVENIQVDLSKVLVSGSPEHNNNLFSNISRQSFSAQEKLNQLPISHVALNKTSKFLAQIADYSSSMTKKNTPLNADQMETVAGLHNSAAKLTEELRGLFDMITDGTIKMGELRREGGFQLARAPERNLDGEFSKIHEKMADYPTLIYDGPFSDHLLEPKPRELKGESITFDRAKEIAKRFVGPEDIREIRRGSDSSGFIKTYGLEIIPEGNRRSPIYVSITKTGGHVAWMLNTRGIGESKLSMEEMKQKAETFLKEKGYANMIATYSVVTGDTGVVNFAYTQDGVIIYPDLLKVKVALDNGEVVGFEAQKFLMSHHDRDIRKPRLTEEEARRFISNQFNVSKGRLALIPLEDKTEVLTYEFKSKYQEDEFLIYINADTGDQEMILKIIKDKTGTLTM